MKKLIMICAFVAASLQLLPQSYKTNYMIAITPTVEKPVWKDRTIAITDTIISIPYFIGGTETQYLVVDSVVEKEYNVSFGGGVYKHYYCTTQDKDVINGYSKAIIIKQRKSIIFALFATEIDVYRYEFYITW